jgi:hypothetical protein
VPTACPSVYDEILEWSFSRPLWQRDALRRLILNGKLDKRDVDEILLFCKIAHGILEVPDPSFVPVPLAGTHICPESAIGEPVILTSISGVDNVNAIFSNNPLTFGETGLTMIYGDNGAGKSGYVRILKNMCRARGLDKEILPNVFATDTNRHPRAKVEFKCGESPCMLDWEKNIQGPSELLCVNVFDSDCASVYVNSENEVAYMPLGLDVFDKLSKACDTIKLVLSEEKEKLVSRLEIIPFEYEGTLAAEWYASISERTDEDMVKSFTSFNMKDEARLNELQKVLFEDSRKKRSAELRTKKERYEDLWNRLESIKESLSALNVQVLRDARSALDAAANAAKLASKEAFEAEPLKGVGSNAWQELWKAAKVFSETEAYPEISFPNTEPGSKCVLCFQDLAQETKNRLKRFRDFVQGETSRKETEARQAFENEWRKIENIQVSKDNDKILLKELKDDSVLLEEVVNRFIESARKRKALALQACEDGRWEEVTGFSEYQPEGLKNLCDELQRTANALEEAENPDVLRKLQQELNKLKAKKWVSEREESIMAEISRQKLLRKYDKAIQDTHTRAITVMSMQLTDKYVTEELKRSFMEQLKAIYGQELNVSLEKKESGKGVTYYYVTLQGCNVPKTKVSKVISEGV